MPYTVRFTDNINKGELIVEDREINTDTSLRFPGKQSTSYGQDIAENFLHLLENFAAPNPPANPAEGQVWYDNSTTVNQLKVYDGTNWVALPAGSTAPTTPAFSDLTDIFKTADMIAYPAITRLNVTASGSSGYLFTNQYNNTVNPLVNLLNRNYNVIITPS